MDLSRLFEMVNQIGTENCYLDNLENTQIQISKISLRLDSKLIESSTKQKKKTIPKSDNKSKKELQSEDRQENSKNKKDPKKTDKDSIIEILDEFTDNNEEESIDLGLEIDPSKSYDHLIAIKQYQQLLDQYKRFLDTYLKDTNNVAQASYAYSSQENEGERKFEWGQEVVTYSEIKESVRKIKMNLLLGGWHNGVSQDEKDRYKFWKYVSKFNKVMAEVIENSVGSGG